MKDSMDSTAVGRALDPEVFANRKLIRPALNRSERPRPDADRRERSSSDRVNNNNNGKKTPPPEQTHAENFYYQKQMQSKTPMVLVLQDGEEIHGIIEWYDKYCLKINRSGSANILVYKPSIKYMFKESEAGGHR
jgi:sRNA-binding regulator protein Hfq